MKFIDDCFKYRCTAVHAHYVRLSDYLYGHLQMFQIYRMTEQFIAVCLTETISCQHRPSRKWYKFGVDDQEKFFKQFKYNSFCIYFSNKLIGSISLSDGTNTGISQETCSSITNYQLTRHNIPDRWISHLHRWKTETCIKLLAWNTEGEIWHMASLIELCWTGSSLKLICLNYVYLYI